MILQQKIEQCQLHLDRIKQAIAHIQHLYPFKPEIFPLNKYEDLASLDLFTSRFAKLQDTMGEILFPEFFKFLGEDVSFLPMIDRLNKLEKYGILQSTAKWKKLRDLRNSLAHEYPNLYAPLAATLNQVFDNYELLEQTLDNIIREYTLRKNINFLA